MLRIWTTVFAVIPFISFGIRIGQSNEVMAPNQLAIYEHDYIRPSNLERMRIINDNPIIERLNELSGVRLDDNSNDIQTNEDTNHISRPKKKQYKSRRARANVQGKDTNPGDIRSIFY